MTTERVSVVVEDKIDSSISKKVKEIGKDAKASSAAVDLLKKALDGLKNSPLGILRAEFAKFATIANKAEIQSNNLAASYFKGETAAQRFAKAVNDNAAAMANAEIKGRGLALVNERVATQAQRTATEQQRTAKETSNAAKASEGFALVQQKVAKEAANVGFALERQATQAQRTAKETANAELANVRLAAQKEKLAQRTNAASASLGKFKAALAAISSFLGAGLFSSITSEFTDYQARIDRISGSHDNATRTMRRLQEMAKRTYSTFQQTAEMYVTNYENLSALGYAQQDVLNYTEAINNALVVSGTKGEAAAAVTNALTKAMGLGALRGQELNSVLARGGRITQVIADHMGVSVTELRKLGAQGKITADVLMDSLVGAFEKLRKEAEDMPATIKDAIQQIKTNMFTGIGNWDKDVGLSRKLADALLFVADNLKAVAVAAGIAGTALAVMLAPKIIMGLFALLNPLVLIPVLLAGASFAMATYGQNVYLAGEECKKFGVTYADVFGAVLSETKDIAKETWKTLKGLFNDIIGAVWKTSDETKKAGEEGFSGFAMAAAVWLDAVVRQLGTLGRYIGNFLADIKEGGLKLAFQDTGERYANALNDSFAERAEKGWVVRLRNIRMLAQENAKKRVEGITGVTDGLDGGGGRGNRSGAGGGNAAKNEIDRAKAIDKINQGLREQITLMGMLKPEREFESQYMQIVNQLSEQGIKLSESEAEAIKDKIRWIQENNDVVSEMDRIYADLNKTHDQYFATIEAAGILLDKGAISYAKYVDEVERAERAYRAAIDPVSVMIEAMEKENELLKMNNKQRRIEAATRQAIASLPKGYVPTDEELERIREAIRLQDDLGRRSQLKDDLFRNSAAIQKQAFSETLDILKEVHSELENLDAEFTRGDLDNAIMNLFPRELVQHTQMMRDAEVAAYKAMYEQIAALRDASLISQQDAFKMSAQVMLMQAQHHFTNTQKILGELKNLTSANSKTMFKIGKAASIASALINTFEGATKAMAQGGIYGYAMAAAVIASGMVQVANIRAQQMPGYKAGGYTGDVDINKITGFVHGREFVMNADATRANRPKLEAMNRGDYSEKQSLNLDVVIINEAGGGVEHEVNQVDDGRVEIIARRVVREETDAVTAAMLANPNSKTRRSLARNTKTEPNFR